MEIPSVHLHPVGAMGKEQGGSRPANHVHGGRLGKLLGLGPRIQEFSSLNGCSMKVGGLQVSSTLHIDGEEISTSLTSRQIVELDAITRVWLINFDSTNGCGSKRGGIQTSRPIMSKKAMWLRRTHGTLQMDLFTKRI